MYYKSLLWGDLYSSLLVVEPLAMQHIELLTEVVLIIRTTMKPLNMIYVKGMDIDISALMGNLNPLVTMHVENMVTVNHVALLIPILTNVIVYKCIT